MSAKDLDFKTLAENNNFSLVLSGGGALGIAHLGVLHDLERLNLLPKEIVGTSMGGIVAACVAIGLKEKEIYKLMERFSSIFSWIKFSMSGNAFVVNDKIERSFDEIFLNKKMIDTKIPLKIITTNLKTGEKKVFTKDDDVHIKDAILATMAIPGIFEERVILNETYGDGFLCENLGLSEATLPDILAVDVLGKSAFTQEMPNKFFKTANILKMFEKSMRLLIYNQTKTNLNNTNKNVLLLEPQINQFQTFHFHKFKDIRLKGMNLLDKVK